MEESLSERLNKLKTHVDTKQVERDKNVAHSRVGKMRSDFTKSGRFLAQLTIGLIWTWQYIIKPLLHVTKLFSIWLYNQYRKLWALVVYKRDRFGDLVFSKTRAGGMFVASILFCWYLLFPILGLMEDTVSYVLTSHSDMTVYLTGSQEIDPRTNMHSIEGCSALPCSESNALYYRSSNTLFNNVWSLLHKHELFYPEYVAGAVPYGLNRCTVTEYGLRFRFIWRINRYNELLADTCIPIEGEHK